MARGFLSGAIWGTVLSLGGLGAVSVLAPEADDRPQPALASSGANSDGEGTQAPVASQPIPATPVETTDAADLEPETPVETPAPDIAEQDVAEVGLDDAAAATSEVDTTEEPDAPEPPARRPSGETVVSPDATAPPLDTPAGMSDGTPGDTTAAPSPETGEEIAALEDPVASDRAVAPPPLSDDAAPDTSAAPTLDAPDVETGLNVPTDPAQPPAPQVPDVETPLAPDAQGTAQSDPTEPDAAGNDTSDDDTPKVRRLIPDAPAETPEETEQTARNGADFRPSIGTPAVSLTDRTAGSSSRLPSINGEGDDADTPEAPDAGGQDSQAVDPSAPPLDRYAAQVDADPALPKMSIVMIDDGTGPLGPNTLNDLPFPVTFAIDPGIADASDRMAAYRALGYEVAVLVTLPEAAQPSDVEQNLAGALVAVPEAVAMIEAPGGNLQGARGVTEQATRFAAESGHGLVFLPNGLNTAEAIARRADVPSISILRDFDGAGQDARTQRRFLDGAAFRARQDGSVVMLGRLRPETLSALVLWSLQDRASSVSIVPISAVLSEDSE